MTTARERREARPYGRVSVKRENGKPPRKVARRAPARVETPVAEPAPAPPLQPAAKPMSQREFTEAAQTWTPAMLKHLTDLAAEAKSEAVRVSAANAVLERAYGRPAPGKAVAEEDDRGPETLVLRWLDSETS